MVTYQFQYDKETMAVLAELSTQEKREARKERITQVVFVIAAVILYLCTFVMIGFDGVDAYSVTYIACATIFLLFAIFQKRLRAHAILKSLLRNNKDMQTARGTWTFADEGIKVDSTLGQGQTYWSAIEKYGDYGKYLYIKRKDNSMFLIERDRLSQAELAELRGLLAAHVVARA